MNAFPRTLALLAALLRFSVVPILPHEPASAAADPWLDEDFEGGGGWLLQLESPSDIRRHQGDGVVFEIPTGQHWDSTGHWNI